LAGVCVGMVRGTIPTTRSTGVKSQKYWSVCYAVRHKDQWQCRVAAALPWISASAKLQRLNLIRLQALRALGHDEADLLAFLQ